MKLKSLTCTNPLFKPLIFKDGLNIVAGLQQSKSGKQSYNGVGKSLSLHLVHLLLGADLKDPALKAVLQEYGEFSLSFIHNGRAYTISKDFGKDGFEINGDHVLTTHYAEKLNEIFGVNPDFVNARQLLRVFAREFNGTFYSDALTQLGVPLSDFYQRRVNLYLLGVDLSLIESRKLIKEKIAKLDQANEVIEEYAPAEDTINTQDLLDERDRLVKLKESFRVAQNHNEMMVNCDGLTAELNEMRNSRFQDVRELARKTNLLKSLASSNLSDDEIGLLYEEATHYFPGQITKRLADAIQFHHQLSLRRKERIESELKAITSRIKLLDAKISRVEIERDNLMALMGKNGALDEYFALVSRIDKISEDIQNATKYEEMKRQFRIDKSRLQTENAGIREQSIVHLAENASKYENIEAMFRKLVKKFYENTGGSLKITETKDAKYLYDIKIVIPKQRSQGVGEVKIFCYDMLLFLLNKNLLGFLAHDGCIFSEMDPRQKSAMIKMAIEFCTKHDLQYFVNMNENTYNEIESSSILNPVEKAIFRAGSILKLFDKNPKSSLLGISF